MTQEQYTPMVGDRVSLEGEIEAVNENGSIRVGLIKNAGIVWLTEEEKEVIKLICRAPSPRKITRKEIEQMVGGSFEIVE